MANVPLFLWGWLWSSALVLGGDFPASLPASPLHLSAQRLWLGPRGLRLGARGRVHLRYGNLSLWAAEIACDRSSLLVTVRGRFRLVQGGLRLQGQNLRLRLGPNPRGYLQQGRLRLPQSGLGPRQRRWGRRGGVTLQGQEIRWDDEEIQLHKLTLTLCECGPGGSPWKIRATQAKIRPGREVLLHWPVLWIYSVPVFAFPLLSLPLQRRKTGFLLPHVSYSTSHGLVLQTSFYLVLGRHADLTVALDWLSRRGIRPGYRLRYARGKMRGTLRGEHLFDARQGENLRFALRWQHHHQPSPQSDLHLRVHYVSDPYYESDFRHRLSEQVREYTSSRWVWSWSDSSRRLGLSWAYFQPLLQFLHQPGDPRQSTVERGVSWPTLHRLPSLVWEQIGGGEPGEPLEYSYRLHYDRFHSWSEERAPGAWGHNLQRGMAWGEVALPWRLGGWFPLRPACRTSLLLYSSPKGSSLFVFPLLLLDAGPSLQRTFAKRWLHRISFRLSYRWLPQTILFGEAPAPLTPLDQMEPLHQLLLRVQTQLWSLGAGEIRRWFWAELRQPFSLRGEPVLGATELAWKMSPGRRFSNEGLVAVDIQTGALQELLLRLVLRWPSLFRLASSYRYLPAGRASHRFARDDTEGPLFWGAKWLPLLEEGAHEWSAALALSPTSWLQLAFSFRYSFLLGQVLELGYQLLFWASCRCLQLRLSASHRLDPARPGALSPLPDLFFFLRWTGLGGS